MMKKKNIFYLKKKIAFTGIRDKETIEKIINYGGEISNSISKNTFALIVKNKDDDSAKIEDAKKFNIPMFTLSEFKEKYF